VNGPAIEGPDVVFPWGIYFAAWLLGPVVVGQIVIALAVKWATRKK